MIPSWKKVFCITTLAAISIFSASAATEDFNSAPNPYRLIENWAHLPEGRTWGEVIGVKIDPDGRSVWVLDRCGGKMCAGSNVAPIQKFDASGNLLSSFGAGLLNW